MNRAHPEPTPTRAERELAEEIARGRPELVDELALAIAAGRRHGPLARASDLQHEERTAATRA